MYLFNGKEVVELTRQKLTTEYILNLFFGHNPDNLDSSQGVFILSYNQSLNSLVITNSGSKHELYFNFKTNSWYGGAWNYRFSNTNYGGFNNEISLQSNIILKHYFMEANLFIMIQKILQNFGIHLLLWGVMVFA